MDGAGTTSAGVCIDAACQPAAIVRSTCGGLQQSIRYRLYRHALSLYITPHCVAVSHLSMAIQAQLALYLYILQCLDPCYFCIDDQGVGGRVRGLGQAGFVVAYVSPAEACTLCGDMSYYWRCERELSCITSLFRLCCVRRRAELFHKFADSKSYNECLAQHKGQSILHRSANAIGTVARWVCTHRCCMNASS